jgi:PadR family transcriptional regulator PadR
VPFANNRDEIPPGTLDMLILQTLSRNNELHGFEIAENIQRVSGDILQVEEGSLYPALQRMLMKGWLTAEWGKTAENRRARYYRLTKASKKQLSEQLKRYERISQAIARDCSTRLRGRRMSARELWRRLRFLCRRNRMTEECGFTPNSVRIDYLNRVLILERPFYTAQRLVGSKLLIEEWSREMWGWMSLERVLQDLRFAVRMLRKHTTMFSMVAIATFALGAGANALMFKSIITSLGRMRSTYCLKTCVMSCA